MCVNMSQKYLYHIRVACPKCINLKVNMQGQKIVSSKMKMINPNLYQIPPYMN